MEEGINKLIKEVIVVEGRDDITAVKRAVEAEIIAVGGFGINKAVIDKIKSAQERCGVIVFTDPDFAGEKIRRIIAKRVKGIKHAYIGRDEGTKNGDIGVENATPEVILRALNSAKFENVDKREFYDIDDMIYFKLTGCSDSKRRRELLGKKLGIGYGNCNQMITRLNNYGVDRMEFIEAIEYIEKNI